MILAYYNLLLLSAPLNDKLRRRFVAIPGLVTLGGFCPMEYMGDVPPELLPSPPPKGWSMGFMATPRTEGRLPFQRLRPALHQRNVLVVNVTNLTHCGNTSGKNLGVLLQKAASRGHICLL